MRLRPVPRARLAAALALGLSLTLVTLLPQAPAVYGTAAASPASPGASSSASGGAPAQVTASPVPVASPALQRFYDQEVTWGGCDGDAAGFECATLTVPLDYSQPDGQTITLALKRLPASDGKAENGSLFLNPGGPGGSGIDMVADAAQILTPQARAAYDVIGFDPRGVGDSSPLTCWKEAGDQAAPAEATSQPASGTSQPDQQGGQGEGGWTAAGTTRDDVEQKDQEATATPAPGAATAPEPGQAPQATETPAAPGAAEGPDTQTTPDGTQGTGTPAGPDATTAPGSPQPAEGGAATTPASRFVNLGRTLAAACEENTPVPELLDNMDAATVAQDMDVMRGVVGDERLNYLGVSYGTYLGAVYAERFPGNVGRMVLDSAMDPSITRTQVHGENMAHLESSLHSYVDYCLAEKACPLTGTRDEALAQLDTFLTGLDNDPLPVDGEETTYNRTDALGAIQFFITRQRGYWPYLTEGLTQAINERNATTLVTNMRTVAGQTGIAGVTDPQDEQVDQQPADAEKAADLRNAQSAFNAIHCSDYPDTGDEATWQSQAASLKEANPFFYSESEAYTDALCHGWGHGTGAREPASVQAPGSQPILVVGVHDDAQTPYPWAEALAEQLDAGHLLSVDEALHGAVGQNSCATQAISSFLVSGTLPKEGAVCQADPVPAAQEEE